MNTTDVDFKLEDASFGANSSGQQRLPVHYKMTRLQLLFSIAALVAAFSLLAISGFRIATRLDLWRWWVPLICICGIIAADFASGLVHWTADTWGRDDMPVIGPRLLTPFRVHHVNPDDLLRRRFIEANGEVAVLAIPVLAGLHLVPLHLDWGGPVALFGLAFCGIGVLTNQIHQWAHGSSPAPVRLLQRYGLILGQAHSVHHEAPYDGHYCITTGWCNRPLEAIRFFRRLEAAITRLTGAKPRCDDQRYNEHHSTPWARREAQIT